MYILYHFFRGGGVIYFMKDIRGGPAMSTCQGTGGRFESWNPLVQCIIGGNLANSCTLRPVQCYHGFFLHFGGVGVNFDFFFICNEN